jgi:hypothetical protein
MNQRVLTEVPEETIEAQTHGRIHPKLQLHRSQLIPVQ